MPATWDGGPSPGNADGAPARGPRTGVAATRQFDKLKPTTVIGRSAGDTTTPGVDGSALDCVDWRSLLTAARARRDASAADAHNRRLDVEYVRQSFRRSWDPEIRRLRRLLREAG